MSFSDTPETIYLVDLENIGVKILPRHMEQHSDSRYIIFYSDSTAMPGVILEQVPQTVRIQFIYCRTGGNNAMDFCISAMAGRLAAVPKVMIKILSNDKGYDPMIHMLQEQGSRIERVIAEYVVTDTSNDDTSVIIDDVRKEALINAIKRNTEKCYWDRLIKILPDARNRSEAHEMMQAVLPNKMISDLYKKLKKFIPKGESQ